MTEPISATDNNLNWLVSRFVEEVTDAAHAILVSADGLLMAESQSIPGERAEQVAAHLVGHAKPDGVTKKGAHGTLWRLDRCLVPPCRIKPGAMHPGKVAFKIADSRDHGRPYLGWCAFTGAIIAARMEAQGGSIVNSGDPTVMQIGFGQRAGDRL